MKKRLGYFSVILVVVFALSTLIATPAMAWFDFNTTVNILGPTEPVPACSTVTLTITETNDSEYENPDRVWIADPWVSLEPGGIILDINDQPTGDTDGDGILDKNETWVWEVDVIVCEDTLFTAVGHGYGQGRLDWDVTTKDYDGDGIPEFQDETCELWVYVTPPDDGEGFTPGYWRNHYEDWTGYSPSDVFDAVFGVTSSYPSWTLEDAVWAKGGGENALIRHGTAALLNAAHPFVDYEYTEAEVIAMVQDAYASGDFNGVKNDLEYYNELGGDITS